MKMSVILFHRTFQPGIGHRLIAAKLCLLRTRHFDFLVGISMRIRHDSRAYSSPDTDATSARSGVTKVMVWNE
jgi:hypothetical protein